MQTKKIDRRAFLWIGSSLASVAAVAYDTYNLRSLKNPTAVFVDLRNASWDARQVAVNFVHADTPKLMASYAVFYPNLLAEGRSALRQIDAAVEEVLPTFTKNRHRLEALPAAASAHLLSTPEEDKEELWHRIFAGLKNPNREIREIIIQNLIEETIPNFNSREHFTVNSDVLSSLDLLIAQAKETDKLLSPLSLCIDFLMNYRLLLRERGADQELQDAVQGRLDAISSAAEKIPHLAYAIRLMDKHEKCFRWLDPNRRNQLPPQRSEALIIHKQLMGGRFTDEYIKAQALIHTRALSTIFRTAIGDDPEEEWMTQKQAREALPKSLQLLKYFGVRALVPSRFDASTYEIFSKENEFSTFLQHDLYHLLLDEPERLKDRYGIEIRIPEPSNEERWLAECRSFAEYRDPDIVTRLDNDYSATRRENLRRLALEGLAAFDLYSMGLASYGIWSKTPMALHLILSPQKARMGES